jgi:hypothetical protein
MSHWAFGFIRGAGALNESQRDDLAWSIVRAGQGVGLHIILSCNICQRVLPEMLEAAGEPSAGAIPFLMTSSPVRDTSDLLISPYNFPGRGIDGVVENLRTMSKWLEAVLGLGAITTVEVWMTEGFDVKFEEWHVCCDEFVRTVAARLAEEGNVPSMRVWVRR